LFQRRFSYFFITKTRSVVKIAQQYLKGLIQTRRKNMERMTEVIPDSDEQSMQHFITNSPWDHRPVLDQVAKDCDRHLGGHPDSALFIDESGIPKKGKKSVGVARQWCGRLGKVDNCQVGVFAALSQGKRVCLIDTRLYMPQEWIDNKARRRKAGVPDNVVFKTKGEQALEMVHQARQNGVRFSWVGADGGYGKDPDFLCRLEDAHEVFLVDVHKDQSIYFDDPVPYVPDRQSNKGRKPTRLVAGVPSQRVDKWVAQQPESAWQRISFRDSSRGKLKADFLVRKIWIWNKRETFGRQFTLIVRRDLDSANTFKYSLTNSPSETPTERLAFMQGQRYFIEHSFQDAKGQVGLDHYQTRKWRSWHHHMTLVIMAMLFMLETKMNTEENLPLLSCFDITQMLSYYLPRRDVTEEEIMRQMEFRHRQRQASIDSAYARQMAQLNVTK
jgi:SRSO17 transposase